MWIYTTLVLASVHLTLGFSCVCSPSECEPLAEDDCPPGAGTVWDPCGCCRVCARTENEPCGGPYGFYGTCGKGLQCVVSDVRSEGVDGTCKRKYLFLNSILFLSRTCTAFLSYENRNPDSRMIKNGTCLKR